MSWKKLNHEAKMFRSAVDYAAIKVATGRSNSAINSRVVKSLKVKDKKTGEDRDIRVGDRVKFAIYQDSKNPLRFGICFGDEESDWNTKVTRSWQIAFWLGSFLENKGILLKGYDSVKDNGKKGAGERFMCEMTEEDGVWAFEIPTDMLVTGDKKETVKVKKDKKEKKKKILKK